MVYEALVAPAARFCTSEYEPKLQVTLWVYAEL
jgi:hypothetical protein